MRYGEAWEKWISKQSPEVQAEFAEMRRKQKEIDRKELNVPFVFYGKSPFRSGCVFEQFWRSGIWTELQRRVLECVVIEGKTQAQAGQELGISREAVKMHLKCIRIKISKHL
jgi:hypothetical protein